MAQRVVTLLIDDLSGEESEDVTNVQFSVAGTDFEIDLNDKNHGEFMNALAPYMKNGRRIKRSRKAGKGPGRAPSAGGSNETAKIREWAKEQGFEVNERGRVPATVREAYEKAH
ncbi:Lsr2 family protein [Streptomyces bathyalis]|uniref:Lsr2 family protein n=1 Tax=Streptomyces bathyalis TaxID=2710756 RepID=A0A7T1WVJ7_9ACTN|nr:Lsr2 family protein [Streptomyces bathyalis]QPP10287.1 Lsr2 family protein [Streptomyces bathyalis]